MSGLRHSHNSLFSPLFFSRLTVRRCDDCALCWNCHEVLELRRGGQDFNRLAIVVRRSMRVHAAARDRLSPFGHAMTRNF